MGGENVPAWGNKNEWEGWEEEELKKDIIGWERKKVRRKRSVSEKKAKKEEKEKKIKTYFKKMGWGRMEK